MRALVKKEIITRNRLRVRHSTNRFLHDCDNLSHVGSNVASISDEMSSNESRCDINDSDNALNVVKECENLKIKTIVQNKNQNLKLLI